MSCFVTLTQVKVDTSVVVCSPHHQVTHVLAPLPHVRSDASLTCATLRQQQQQQPATQSS